MSQAPAMPRMRRVFADILHDRMRDNEKIWVVTADLGYKMWDPIRTDYPERFINVGAAEQCLVGMGVGLALEGKIPVLYSIASFLLYRPFETIRNYINHEKIPVKLVGAGRERDYTHDGFSHWAEEDRAVMGLFNNITAYWPDTSEELEGIVDEMITNPVPVYINLKK